MPKVTTPCPPLSSALLDGDLPRQLHRAPTWALDTRLFAHLTVHRNNSWTFPHLILLILLWVWSERGTRSRLTSTASFFASLPRWAIRSATVSGSGNVWASSLTVIVGMVRLRARW